MDQESTPPVRFARSRAAKWMLLGVLAPPSFSAGLVIGGCDSSARDDFLAIRGASLVPIRGDSSVYREARAVPMPRFVVREPVLTRAPDE